MSSVAESTSTVQMEAALRMATAQATCRYAGEAARIDRGLVLALNGAVTLHADGTASVQSASDAEIVYTVNGKCDCKDVARAPESRCKHVWAKALVKKAHKLIAARNAPKFYATYYAPDDTMRQGTAQYIAGHGWEFCEETGGDVFYAAQEALVLGGNVAILEAQRVEDGDLVRKVTGYA